MRSNYEKLKKQIKKYESKFKECDIKDSHVLISYSFTNEKTALQTACLILSMAIKLLNKGIYCEFLLKRGQNCLVVDSEKEFDAWVVMTE